MGPFAITLAAAVVVVVIAANPRDVVAQTPALSSYQATVERYQRGSHVASVLDLLKVNPTDAKRDALATLDEHERLYEFSRKSVPGRKSAATYEGGARAYVRLLQSVAALHLEAAIAAPFSRQSQRLTHLEVAQTAFRVLDPSRKGAWTTDASIDSARRAAVTRFRRDWSLVAITHFQRIGAFIDALRLVGAALDEHGDDPVFHVIAGSISEALSAPVASFDAARASIGLPSDPDDAMRLALRNAARHFERALVLNPEDAEARVRLARVQVHLGAFGAARRYLDADAPSGRMAYLLTMTRGQAAAAEERRAEAVNHYRAAVTMAPQWQSGCVALAHALVTIGQRSEARDTVRTCISVNPAPDDPWASYRMGLHWLPEPTVRQLRASVSTPGQG